MFERLIVEEKKKKEEKNEKLLANLCECRLILCHGYVSDVFISICVPCFVKVALSKEESEKTRKEVEMALLALSCIKGENHIEKGSYLKGMIEIIKYHQENHNLTHLAYQSAWKFLIDRFQNDLTLKKVIMNELHFVREATRELEELSKSVNCNRKGKEENETAKNVPN
ncbi:uncharacterized protein MONOS_17635 [Monocercomonoides exilis]|uniref:uncharacterized protein n=1 Tax=Monocercomonoides exilis TaxID=2049356 RepID=UPI0035595930|nr:hypothetical protein MONOS_17635 [Monocercomonoides exilis]